MRIIINIKDKPFKVIDNVQKIYTENGYLVICFIIERGVYRGFYTANKIKLESVLGYYLYNTERTINVEFDIKAIKEIEV